MTALMLAAQRGHKDTVQALVERKANPNITDKVYVCMCGSCITVHYVYRPVAGLHCTWPSKKAMLR